MTPSSRTPEGDPQRCDFCGKLVRLEPSSFPTRDAPCPHCGSLLCFVGVSSEEFASARFARERVAAARRLVFDAERGARELEETGLFFKFERITWTIVAVASAVMVWLHDGAIAIAALWLLLIMAFGHFVLPWAFRAAGELLNQHDSKLLCIVLGWGLVPGPLIGVIFGVLIPWMPDCGLSSFAGGLVGLIAGPCFAIIEGLVLSSVVFLCVWIVNRMRRHKRAMSHLE